MDADDLADIFAAFGPVSVRRMFGGQGVFADGLMFALVIDDELHLKANAELAALLEAEGARPFAYERSGRLVSLGYWTVPDGRIDDPDRVAEVARAALTVARRAKAKSPTRVKAARRPRGSAPDE